ncbi:hypothetical protein A1O1_07100 [Capronia coronata CBS 617.96]|uniref:Uncharacterized protein n=1 Tax=Capronia coronata CBS 617.96 TaxID=1182541 RepID=W9XSF7_9EURO|nr:uncharacterized protein A1O1_07100 [Capronia coronata CBS 617.96]EXJ83477.1 hypothetical protein A1O1_07100 [Capronia coronata CBS 617.96]
MARNKHRDSGRRYASASPQRAPRPPPTVIDLTQSDPWADRSTARAVKPNPLSPAFGGRASTVAVPEDPKSTPAYLFQQLALARNRASVRPSFSSRLPTNGMDGQGGENEDEADETPTPDQKEVKEKRKKKSKNKKEKQELEEAKANKKQDGKKENNKSEDVKDKRSKQANEKSKDDVETPVGSKKKSKKVKQEPIDPEPVSTLSRKRKRGKDDESSSQKVGEVEADAVNKLRDSLPTVRVSRVARDLQRETGSDPTDIAIVATAARETIIDLARQQLEQTEQSYHLVQTELLRMLRQQNKRLERLEGKRAEDSSDEEGADTIDRPTPREACAPS